MFSLSEGGEASSFSLLLISRRRENYFASPVSSDESVGLCRCLPHHQPPPDDPARSGSGGLPLFGIAVGATAAGGGGEEEEEEEEEK